MALSKLESSIIVRVAQSPEKLSAWDFQDIGYYANVHNSCKKLVDDGMLESDSLKNKKGASKKVFQLTLRGFCKLIESIPYDNLFPNSKKPDCPYENFTLFLERWKHLHEGIECFYILLMKFQDEKKFIGIGNFGINGFLDVCSESIKWDDSTRKARKIIPADIPENDTLENIFWGVLIKQILRLPAEMEYAISFDDIAEIFENTSGTNEFKWQIEMRLKECDGLYRWYKKYY